MPSVRVLQWIIIGIVLIGVGGFPRIEKLEIKQEIRQLSAESVYDVLRTPQKAGYLQPLVTHVEILDSSEEAQCSYYYSITESIPLLGAWSIESTAYIRLRAEKLSAESFIVRNSVAMGSSIWAKLFFSMEQSFEISSCAIESSNAQYPHCVLLVDTMIIRAPTFLLPFISHTARFAHQRLLSSIESKILASQ